jgi:hypothetical protein
MLSRVAWTTKLTDGSFQPLIQLAHERTSQSVDAEPESTKRSRERGEFCMLRRPVVLAGTDSHPWSTPRTCV